MRRDCEDFRTWKSGSFQSHQKLKRDNLFFPRPLAVEIEATLRRNLKPLGIRVSEIYGGFDISATEEILIKATQVLIATPEKFDATIRLVPELLDGVRLVIFDEGHLAGDISERGMRSEFLLNRLLCRLGRDRCRYIFISAVLPNPSDFAKWIGGDNSNIASSEWRPSRMVLGKCIWNGRRVRVNYTHESSIRLEQEVFIDNFLPISKVQGLEGVGRRRNPFPHEASEAFAGSAIKFTQYGSTLAFIPQAQHVVSVAAKILKSITIMKAIAKKSGLDFNFPQPDESSSLMQECISAIVDEFGDDAEILTFIKAGIAIHHGNLPARVRLLIERLVRSGEIKLIVATTTLGQGVNLPIRTVLVRGIQQGPNRQLDPLDFWNIAGRAGRALQENEGQILFFIDETKEPWQVRRQKSITDELIERIGIQAVIGLLHRALMFMRNLWKTQAPEIDFNTLCLKLAEDDFSWSDHENRNTLQYIFELIDQHLLALTIEFDFTPDQPDSLQEVMRESLLFTQLEAHPIGDIEFPEALKILSARLIWINSRVPDPNRRKRYYSIGMSLSDCSKIEDWEVGLKELIGYTAAWGDLSEEQRLFLLIGLAKLALMLDSVQSSYNEKALPIDLFSIIKGWLSGQKCIDMINSGMAPYFGTDVGRLSRFLEKICVYAISWSVNGFINYVKQKFEEDGLELPYVAEFLPSMFKIGVSDPVATIIAPYLMLDRPLSLAVAEICPHSFDYPNRVIGWLNDISKDDLIASGIEEEDAERIIRIQRNISPESFFERSDETFKINITVATDIAREFSMGDNVLFRTRPDKGRRYFDIFTINGKLIGRYRLRNSDLPNWLNSPNLILSTAGMQLPESADTVKVEINTRKLAM